jgi:hypothetical protein
MCHYTFPFLHGAISFRVQLPSSRSVVVLMCSLSAYSSEEASALLVLVLVVYALCGLARVGGVVDDARLPVLVLRELALELKGMIDAGEAELDEVALQIVLA